MYRVVRELVRTFVVREETPSWAVLLLEHSRIRLKLVVDDVTGSTTKVQYQYYSKVLSAKRRYLYAS